MIGFDNTFKKNINFLVAIYVRLSKSDENKNRNEQSKSINNQKEICYNYLEELSKTDNTIITYEFKDYYIDDGFSGSNFDRPAFKDLQKDILNKKINMVITKDLSRLGRDHIESDRYLEKWFPENNTRYISILDNIDTFNDNSNNEIAPIINWANERHNKETSKKIKRTFRKNINKGLFMGSQPPYGLIRNPNDKHRLIPDEEVRPIIKDIFLKASEEWSINKIAEYLTGHGIPIPSVHTNSNRGIKTKTFEYWDPHTVKDILTNEMYIGNMVQGKTTKLNHKSKKITYIPKEDWVIVEGTHEAIIDKKLFNLVQSIIKRNSHIHQKTTSFLFKGLLKCKECSHSIGIQPTKTPYKVYTVCNYYKKYSKYNLCFSHRFDYYSLEEIILRVIQIEFKRNVDYEKLIDNLNKVQKVQRDSNRTHKLLKQSEIMIKKYKIQIENSYMDKLNNKITEELFNNVKEKLDKKIVEEQKKIIELKNRIEIEDNPNFSQKIDNFIFFKNIQRTTLIQIIDKIIIDREGNIDIFLNCHNNS